MRAFLLSAAFFTLEVSAPTYQCAPGQLDELAVPFGMAQDRFGSAVAVAGERVLVGMPGDDEFGTNSGSVVVYERVGEAWMRRALLGVNEAGAAFGSCVELAGDRVAIGAPQSGVNGPSSGAVHVFELQASGWVRTATLTPAGASSLDHFGASLSMHADGLLIGAPGDDHAGPASGKAYLFELRGADWVQTAAYAEPTPAAGNQFAYSVEYTGNGVFIGSPGTDDGALDTGAVYVYSGVAPWFFAGDLSSVEREPGARFGHAIDVELGIMVVGAPGRGSAYRHGLVHFLFSTEIGWVPDEKGPIEPAFDLPSFGSSLDLWFDPNETRVLLLAGAPAATGGGRVLVYERIDAEWFLGMALSMPNALGFGGALAFDGSTGVFGAALTDVASGAAFVCPEVSGPDCGSEAYCTSTPNSTGSTAQLFRTGSLSFEEEDLTLLCTGLPSSAFGMLITGFGPWNVGLGDGVLCVAPAVSRVSPLLTASGNGIAEWTMDFDQNYPFNLAPFSNIWLQFVYRDLAGPGGTGVNFSNGLRIRFCP